MDSVKQFTPRPYQRLIIDHIGRHPYCACWCGMGTGKTVSTLTALEALIHFFGEGPALVIAPLRVAVSTWPDEVRKWAHLSHLAVSVLCGSRAKREHALMQKADVYTINYESLPWLVEATKSEWPFPIVVADESTRLKSCRRVGGGKYAGALRSVRKHIKRLVELSGTPAANGLLDLWGQFYLLDGGRRLEKSMSAYQARHFRPIRTGDEPWMVRWVPAPGSDERIKAAVSDIALTINAEDYFDIENPIECEVPVELPAPALRMHREMEQTLYTVLREGISAEAVNAQVRLGKCLQIASGAVYGEDGQVTVVHKAKLDALKSVVAEAAGAPVLVAYQFKHEAARILEAIPQAELLDKNPDTIRRWNRGEIPVLLAHPAACGHGLNLQDGGNILCFFSLGWNYEQHAQMCERIGPTRQAQSGHPRPVFIYYLVAKDTLDEAVLPALRRKENVLNTLLGRSS